MNSVSESQVAESGDAASLNTQTGDAGFVGTQNGVTKAVRLLGWCILALMLVFVVNNFLSFGAGLPGAGSALSESGGSALGWMQFAFYPIAIIVAALH
ncbi:MAG: hypothetical protein JKX93_04925, partial [Rhizobiaceae bacterium]|nr:hypothetical protein [Rhizobiaceae bacterium]